MSPPAGSAAPAGRSVPIRFIAIPLLVALTVLIWLAPRFTDRVQSERAQLAWFNAYQAAWFDAYQVMSPRQIVSMPATIVEIDQKSLAALGQWPWPRPVLAQLVRDINRHRPAAIGIDILMPESDGRSLERLLARTGSVDPTSGSTAGTAASVFASS